MSADKLIESAALQLREAAIQRKPCTPLRQLIGDTDIKTAYAIQAINTALRLAEGARIAGYKIGLTSFSVQKQLGVDQPDFGMLFSDKEVLNGQSLSMQELLQPKAEAEIAFVLKEDLDSDSIGVADILSAIDYALASIEIVGSRIENWDIKITDTIADNASASHFVLGHRPMKLNKLDLTGCKMVLTKNKEQVSEGKGSACMGSPVNAMLWLAKTMVKMDSPMRAGQVILTGALGPMVEIKAGDEIEAHIEGLGSVSLRITD